MGLHFLAFWPCGPSFPCILALWAFNSLHFGLVGLHFLAFWPFRGQHLGSLPPTSCQKWPVCPTSLQWIYQRRDRLHFAVFSLVGLHFLAFWLCGPSFPCILALWAFISFHFGPFGVSFWGPPTSCQKWPVCPTSVQWIYQRRDRLHFAVFSLLGLQFLAFWPCGLHFLAFWPCGPSFPCILALWAFISLHFGLAGLHFLAFWPCGPSFPCILALWAFISLHFGLLGLHFLAFWPSGPSFPCILALWAFISLHFGPVGLHFLVFWHCGSSFPCILALWAFISLHFGLVGLHFLSFWPFRGQLLGAPPQVGKNGPFAQRPYNGFISAVAGSILQFLALWAFISLHFGLVGLHFLAFWPCGPSFPCILALWAFISFHFGLFGVSFWGPRRKLPKMARFPTSVQWIYQRRDRLHFAVFSLLGLHFLAFWPCGPSFLCILALWAFISLHFGLAGLHFLAFWHCGFSFPCILALWAFIFFHFGILGFHFLAFWPCWLSFPFIFELLVPFILALWAFIFLFFGFVGFHFLAFWPFGPLFF